jgi:hypothetical protein
VFVRAGLIETDAYLAAEGPMTQAYLTLPVQTVYPLTAGGRPVRSPHCCSSNRPWSPNSTPPLTAC